MNCYEILPLLSGHIDQMNTAQEETALQEHLSSCPECRALLAQMEQNDALLRRGTVQPPADLTDRIRKEIRKNGRRSRVNKPAIISAVVSGLSVAAVMALVFFGRVALPLKGAGAAEPLSMNAAAEIGAAEEVEAPAEVYTEAAELSPAETYAAVTTAAPAETAAYLDSEPETPATEGAAEGGELHALPELPAEAVSEEDSALSAPVKRGIHGDPASALTEPFFVIWGADPADLSELSGCAPITPDTAPFIDSAGRYPDTLLSRLSYLLPLADLYDAEAYEFCGFEMTAYTVSYQQMLSLFGECIGRYETSIYYPSDLRSAENCLILIIRQSDGLSAAPQTDG